MMRGRSANEYWMICVRMLRRKGGANMIRGMGVVMCVRVSAWKDGVKRMGVSDPF